METPSAYNEQLKTKSDPSENVMNLSKKSFSPDTSELRQTSTIKSNYILKLKISYLRDLTFC